MKEISSPMANASKTTFEATNTANLHHYDISSALQTSLEFTELTSIFSSKIQSLVAHDAIIYQNDGFGLEYKKGVICKHSCSYTLSLQGQPLGKLKLLRRKRFEKSELQLLETLLCCLIYPLKNASAYQQALKMAYTDPLTKTSNRAALNDVLNREITLANRNSRELSLIFLDIDHFKSINDSHGHDCGDLALASVAKWIKESIRSSDIVFRFGGEEFVILLSDSGIDGAQLLAERIRANIENHTLAYGMKTLNITASLGISSLQGNDTVNDLVKRADDAMYLAKQTGRNRVQAAA